MVNQVINKPWGYETIFCITDHYVGKFITVHKGHRLSYQYHNKKKETMYLLSGSCELILNGELMPMPIGQSIDILPNMKHRIIARSECTILEISTPELDDVVRLEDDYGRGTMT